MKVYVVKNDKNEYMTETGDFIKSLWQAELFYDYECAYCYAPTGCNIVECFLMEKYQLSDYTKQVRKEVYEEFEKQIAEKDFKIQKLKSAIMGTCPANYISFVRNQVKEFVREEVVQEIKENLLKLEPNCIKQPNLYDFNCQEIIDILDQIQGDNVE